MSKHLRLVGLVTLLFVSILTFWVTNRPKLLRNKVTVSCSAGHEIYRWSNGDKQSAACTMKDCNGVPVMDGEYYVMVPATGYFQRGHFLNGKRHGRFLSYGVDENDLYAEVIYNHGIEKRIRFFSTAENGDRIVTETRVGMKGTEASLFDSGGRLKSVNRFWNIEGKFYNVVKNFREDGRIDGYSTLNAENDKSLLSYDKFEHLEESGISKILSCTHGMRRCRVRELRSRDGQIHRLRESSEFSLSGMEL